MWYNVILLYQETVSLFYKTMDFMYFLLCV